MIKRGKTRKKNPIFSRESTSIDYDELEPFIEIHSLRTRSRNRNRGSARRAMREFLDMADQKKKDVRLFASPLDKRTKINRLVNFYRELGFEETGKKINALGHPEMMRYHKNPLISGNDGYRHVNDVDNWMYHYGDTGIGADTVQWRMGAGRGTGHFGTGTYFVSEARRQSPKSMFYGQRPEYRVNVSGLKLITFRDSDSADKFHRLMKEITEIVSRREDGEEWVTEARYKLRDPDRPAGRKLSRIYSEPGTYGSRYAELMGQAKIHESRWPARIGRPMRDVLDKQKIITVGLESELRRVAFYLRMILDYGQPRNELRTTLTDDEIVAVAKPIIDKHARFRVMRARAKEVKPMMITAGTELLMKLGYDGIDARNTTSDSFDRGSVLFPGWQTKVPPEAIQRMR